MLAEARSALGWLLSNWQAVYRHNGGGAALLRCAYGGLRLRAGWVPTPPAQDLEVDCVTFSVVPGMTALWAALIDKALPSHRRRIIVGDCSGGFVPPVLLDSLQVVPLPNLAHGAKLDLFMRRLCTAKYVLVCDDDVFWLSQRPWRWAVDCLTADPDAAVVSLMPRTHAIKHVRRYVSEAMGSYCLVIRRDIWVEEGLSFAIVRGRGEGGRDWIYDTADLANVELVRRGYHVAIAPPEVREELVALEGISQWTLKIRKHRGHLTPLIADSPLKQMKAMRAVLVARALEGLVQREPSLSSRPVANEQYLQVAERICVSLMSPQEVREVRRAVDTQMAKLAQARSAYSPPAAEV